MEKEPHYTEKSPETPDRKERFMELMEKRHRYAILALQVERILTQEEPSDEYPTTLTPENIKIEKEAMDAVQPLLDELLKAGYLRNLEDVKSAIHRYLQTKVAAQRTEIDLKKKLIDSYREPNEINMGAYLFRQKTGHPPSYAVTAIRHEGYFIIEFDREEDYLDFAGLPAHSQSEGLFHRAMKLPGMTFDAILSRHRYIPSIVVHERQHFINHTLFQNFSNLERYPVPETSDFPPLSVAINENMGVRRSLQQVKDELLARLRDGSNPIRATNFFGDDLYGYLRDQFSPATQVDVFSLLEKIKSELWYLGYILDSMSAPSLGGILVYHLVDIPLIRFPERIRALEKFLSSKMTEFTKLIPPPRGAPIALDSDTEERLEHLELTIVGEVNNAIDLFFGREILGGEASDYDKISLSLAESKNRIRQLREKYDRLSATI